MQTKSESTDKRLDVVIIGGPRAPELVPDWCSVSWVPCSLDGLKQIRDKVADADLLVFWPDWRLLGQYPRPIELLQFDIPGTDHMNPPYRDGKKTKRCPVRRDAIYSYLEGGVSDPHQRDVVFSWISNILAEVMEKANIVAKGGHGVILVVPSDYLDWKNRGADCDGKSVPWRGHAADCFHWFSDKLRVYEAEGVKAVHRQPIVVCHKSKYFNSLVAAHENSVDAWSYLFAMNMRIPGLSVVEQYDDVQEGSISAPYIMPYVNGNICFCPTVEGRTGGPRNLVFAFSSGKRGGYIVMPEPRSIDALLGCLPQSLVEEKDDGDFETWVPRLEGQAIISADPAMKLHCFRKLILEDDCKKAKNRIDSLLEQRKQTNPLTGDSPAMLRMYVDILDAVNHPKDHVLVHGEKGTGKKLVYELLRRLFQKGKEPFEIPASTMFSGTNLHTFLFGHEVGSFTGAIKNRQGAFLRASGGTIVFDNIQNENKEFFNQLLRVLESDQMIQGLGVDGAQSANCRIICGFNRPIAELVDNKSVPDDWPARFEAVIEIPRLDDRKEDIPALIGCFVDEYWAERPELAKSTFSRENLHKECESEIQIWQCASWSNCVGQNILAGEDANVRALRKAVRNHLKRITRFVEYVEPLEPGPGNSRKKMSIVQLQAILLTAKRGDELWSDLKPKLVKDEGGEKCFTWLKSLRKRVNDEPESFSQEIRDYVEGLKEE